MASQDRFGYEWAKYNKVLPAHESQFWMWVQPLRAEDFANKVVLDAGCGMGRNSYWCCRCGVSKLLAFDCDWRSVKAARSTLAPFGRAEVKYANIYEIDFQERFDIIFSVGVIHHLLHPKLALLNLYQALKPGGRLIVWVYGDHLKYKIMIINFIRFFTSRLPVAVTHLLTYTISTPLFIFLRLFPQKSEYLRLIGGFSFWHLHAIVFDQLIPKVANYWSKSELQELFRCLPGENKIVITAVKNYSWSILVTKTDR